MASPKHPTPAQTPTPYKARLAQLKHQTILSAVNALLASKGYEAMTVDEVAQTAGMAKASLYKLYPSKESLAGAAMVGVMDLALALVNQLRQDEQQRDIDKLKAVTRWAMQTKLEGAMPSLPAQNSKLSEALQAHDPYTERLFELSMKLGVWIGQAQAAGDLRADVPSDLILYRLYACACDPVLDVVKRDQAYEHSQALEWLLALHFEGMTLGAKRKKD